MIISEVAGGMTDSPFLPSVSSKNDGAPLCVPIKDQTAAQPSSVVALLPPVDALAVLWWQVGKLLRADAGTGPPAEAHDSNADVFDLAAVTVVTRTADANGGHDW